MRTYKLKAKFVLALTVIFLLSCSSCSKIEHVVLGELDPILVFESNSEDVDYSFTAARNIALDSQANLYIFDYMDNTIKKYDQKGEHIVTFGGQGEGEGKFSHLMDIRVFGDQLFALDSVGTLIFDLKGLFIEKMPFQEEIVMEFPQVRKDGYFVGVKYSDKELKKILTLRDPMAMELERLAEYDLREFFPELEEGKDFFLQDYQARSYLYDFQKNDSVIWSPSDECKVYAFKEGLSTELVTFELTPLPIAAEQIVEMEEGAERAKQNPMLHMYVPKTYQIIQHLLAASNGDIWVYVLSAEKAGFLVFSPKGKLKSFYTVNSDFDMTRVKVEMFGGKIYYLVTGRKSAKVFASNIPAA